MSILLIGLEDDLAAVLARRLFEEGDEVRILVTDEDALGEVPEAPVHIASGRYLADSDLIERACQNVRTTVLGDRSPVAKAIVDILQGAKAAGVGRIVFVSKEVEGSLRDRIVASGLEYGLLSTGKRGLLRRSVIPVEAVAEAIDAVDDLSGEVRLDLDLTDARAWASLRVKPPEGVGD